MKEIQFVDAKQMKTLEHYAASLLSGMISLRTLSTFHLAAFNKGLLDEDESETGKTLCWEIQRLLALYQTQINHVLDRTELNEKDIIHSLKMMMPNVKIPKKKVKSKEITEIQE